MLVTELGKHSCSGSFSNLLGDGGGVLGEQHLLPQVVTPRELGEELLFLLV